MGNIFDRFIFSAPLESSFERIDLNMIYIETENKEIVSAYFINRNAPMTILFCHGNAENIYILYDYFEEVSEIWNVNIFLYDYLGYGESTGIASEQTMYLSGQVVYDYIINTLKIKPENLIVYGKSIGTCAAVELAITRKVKGVILQSALLSLFNICFKTRYVLPFDSFCNIKKIRKVPCYVFFIHGTHDNIVPFYHGMKLYESCVFKVNPYWVINAKHNDVELIENNKFNQSIISFIEFLSTQN